MFFSIYLFIYLFIYLKLMYLILSYISRLGLRSNIFIYVRVASAHTSSATTGVIDCSGKM
jgi:hypothetical protein